MLVIWATMASWYHLGLVPVILATTGVVQADTSFNFSSFPTAESFLVLNDTEHSPSNASFLLNLNAATMEPSCGRLLYNRTIRMKNATSGALTSFHTAFTFQISGPNKKFVAAPVFYHGDGLAFTFVKVPILTNEDVNSGSGLCLLTATVDPFFAIEFDTYKTEAYADSSDSHVGVNLNSMNSTWSYNLCEDKEYCSYLCNGGYFTAWIDYYSKPHILRVFLTKGSLQETVAKPEYPLIDADISGQIAKLVDEFMYVGFSSSTGLHREVHEIKSWTFTSSMTEGGTAPPSSPRPSVSSPGSRRKKIIAGTTVAACGVVFLVLGFICYWRFSTESNASSSSNEGFHPLRIFISHTGGSTGSEKNFAIFLSEALKADAERLKSNYDVFIDRTEMKKGVPFPEEIMQQIKITDLGIVIVTDEFFKKRWPMIELVQLMELQKQTKDGRLVLVLPLFYKLTVTELKSRLERGSWEDDWTGMSTEKHPVDLEELKAAVNFLCRQNGVEYNFRDDSHETEYIQQILSEVDKIYKRWTLQVQGVNGAHENALLTRV